MLGPTNYVLQKDNGIVDQESDGESERHQRQIIDREPEHAHHREREQ